MAAEHRRPVAVAQPLAALRSFTVRGVVRGEWPGRTSGDTSVQLGRTLLDGALQPWADGTLQVLASGPLPPNPSELLGSQGMQDLLRVLEQRADIVLVDAPPLLPVTDAAVLGTLTTGLVMLIHSNTTRREQVARAVETVHAVGATLLGSVLNMVPTKGPDSYSYGYGYGYSYKPAAGTGRLGEDESPAGPARRPEGSSQSGIRQRREGAAAAPPIGSAEEVLPHLRHEQPDVAGPPSEATAPTASAVQASESVQPEGERGVDMSMDMDDFMKASEPKR